MTKDECVLIQDKRLILRSVVETVGPKEVKVHYSIELSKDNSLLDAAEYSFLLNTLMDNIRDCTLFYIDDKDTHAMIGLIRERNEWRTKYEELKSHVDFMKELYGGGGAKR